MVLFSERRCFSIRLALRNAGRVSWNITKFLILRRSFALLNSITKNVKQISTLKTGGVYNGAVIVLIGGEDTCNII